MTGCDFGPGVYDCLGTRNGHRHCCQGCMVGCKDPAKCDEKYKQPVCYTFLCNAMKKKVAQDKKLLDEYGELCKKGLIKEVLGI